MPGRLKTILLRMFKSRTELQAPQIIDGVEVVRRPAARRLRLTVDPRTGVVRLVMPKRAALGPALDWVKSQGDWIAMQRDKLPAPDPIIPGMTITFAGQVVTLDWDEGHPRNPVLIEDHICIGGPLDLMPERLRRWMRREAKRILEAETREYAGIAGVTVGKVSIGDPRSRWGSCSASGDIRYSWRLILAPTNVRRATVAHEVAHRVHMDHSRAFHAVVAKIYGRDPKVERQWLRREGAKLHWFGEGA
jgi:predicted metal-dependent hydrolase